MAQGEEQEKQAGVTPVRSRKRRPFDECWRRIKRANRHRDGGGRQWNAFIQKDPYKVTANVNDYGTGGIWIEQIKPIPQAIAFEIGEFLYHLRATLDGCVYEAACLNTGQRPPPNEEDLEFPIRDHPAKFKEARRKIAPLTKKQRDIVESVQTYMGPSLPPELLPFSYRRGLEMLNDWARKDRHRRLHVVATLASNIAPMLIYPSRTELTEFVVLRPSFILKDQSQIASFHLRGWKRGMKVNANPNLTLDLALDEIPLPCHPKDTFAVRLQCMVRAVAEVVGSIASTYEPELFD